MPEKLASIIVFQFISVSVEVQNKVLLKRIEIYFAALSFIQCNI